MEASIFRLISIGKSSENKKRGYDKLNVLCNELATASNGEVNFNPTMMGGSFKDVKGEDVEIEAIVTREIECIWLPSEDNRVTSPDIRRDELVEVWRLGDTAKYYWRSMGLSNGLRALESVIYAWGAAPNLEGYGLDLTKCYMMAVSAHDKHFTIQTSKANGELYSYTIQINAAESAVYITDDADNYFELDSVEKRLQMKNSDGTFVKVEKKFIELNADQYINFKVMDTVTRMTPTGVTTTTKDYKVISTTTDINSSATIKLTTGKVTAVCDSWEVI